MNPKQNAIMLFEKYFEIIPNKNNLFMTRRIISKVIADQFLEGAIYAINENLQPKDDYIIYLKKIQEELKNI